MKKILQYVLLALFCFAGCLLMFNIIRDGFIPLASFIGACIIFVVMISLRKTLSPYRWLAAGIIMAVLFTIYPIFYTVYLSFTNMSGGHLLTKQQAVRRLSETQYTPEDGVSYNWTGYRSENGRYLIVVAGSDGSYVKAEQNGECEPFTYSGGNLPAEIDGYKKLTKAQTVQSMQFISSLKFGRTPETVSIISIDGAQFTKPAYVYDEKRDIFTDSRTHTEYSPVRGTYTSADGKTLIPGFMVNIGVDNYTRFLGNEGYRKPLFGILLWNIAFSLFSVLISFAIGLMIALLFEDMPYKRVIRSLLIIPYPIPVLVSIMVWRALLNERMGFFTRLFESLFGSAPHFFTDIFWARTALIVINVYLSYPYFYILASGALKSISRDIFEAAAIDGAGPVTVLHKITLPLLMRILAPMVIASFSFNFNNFTLIWGFNAGLPAMADTIVPMGYTDLLISFIYRLGFSTANAADYGFSAAITVLLFLLVAAMVFFQTRNTRTVKES